MPPDGDPQLWYFDRKSHYTNVALGKADNPSWDPQAGWDANRSQMVNVYTYYRDLAVAQPDTFLWAGLGHMAGAEIVGAMDHSRGLLPEAAFIATGRDIFYDLAWQFEAFLDTPDTVVELAQLHDQFGQYPRYDADGTESYVTGGASSSYGGAWQKIASGDPGQVTGGNLDLLHNEQASVVQPGYDYLKTVVGAGLPTPFTNPVHPYHRAFIIDLPNGNVLDLTDRWQWITLPSGMWQNWVAAGPDERSRLVQMPFETTVQGDFGTPGRPDLLPPGGP